LAIAIEAYLWVAWLVENHPLCLGALFFVVVFCVNRKPAEGILHAAALTVTVAYLVIATWYLTVPQYSDHAEPTVAAVSWVVQNGGSAYDPASAELYAFPYGPVLYIANGWVLAAAGPTILSSKALSVCAGLGSLFLTVLLCHRKSQSRTAVALLWLTTGYLTFRTASIWVRPEPLILLMVAICLAGSALNRWSLAGVLLGLAVGVGTAIKPNAVLFAMPAIALLWTRHRLKSVALCGSSALVVFAGVLALSNARLADYQYWAFSAVQHGFRWRSLPAMLEWAVLLSAAPLATLYQAWRSKSALNAGESVARWTLVACLLGSAVLAAKRGTGMHHFLPFLPSLVLLEAADTRADLGNKISTRQAVIASVILVLSLAAGVGQLRWLPGVAQIASYDAIKEIHDFDRLYPGPLSVGYASPYRLSFLRPVPVFDGQPFQLDAVALMDRQIAGHDVSRSTTELLRSCRVKTWLLPHGGEPFQLQSAYDPALPVFSSQFVTEFHKMYELVKVGRYFDVWQCSRETKASDSLGGS
jgi:hypothetical protein